MRISDWSSDVCTSRAVWAVEIGRAAMNSSVFEIVTQEYAGLGDRCSELELQQARRALALLKNAIGPEGILALLGSQLEEEHERGAIPLGHRGVPADERGRAAGGERGVSDC